MSRGATVIACAGLTVLAPSCAATSGSVRAVAPTVVEFSFEKLTPETVRIAAEGNVTWVNTAADTRAFVVFPATISAAFTCGENLAPYFRRTPDGYQSLPITDYESERVELPCPLKPGSHPYEIWILGAGLADTGAARPERKLRGIIVVE